jgi:glycerophosphoryl diester phosphodiesterase
METYDRRTFLKHSAMMAATVATGQVLIPSAAASTGRANPQGINHPFFAQARNRQRPEVIAHRGGDGQWPGETMYAMRQAMKAGVDVLEMDVYRAKDGELVLMHDRNIETTTRVECSRDKDCMIGKFNSAQLQELNAAYNWSNDNGESHPYRENVKLTAEVKNDLRVPTLKEVFEEFPKNTRMVIEMKKAPDEFSPVDKLCELIQKHGKEESVLVASFHPRFLRDFRAKLPKVATSFTFDSGDFKEFLKILLNLGKNSATNDPAKPDAIQVPYQAIKPWMVQRIKSHNIALHAWTVNDLMAMSKMKALGVDGIITDYPGPLLSLLNSAK